MTEQKTPTDKVFKFDETKPISENNPWDAGAFYDAIEAKRLERFLKELEINQAEPNNLSLEEKTAAAYSQAAYYETGLNGSSIDWRYWVHQMPQLSAAQASSLMSALEPDVFANLNGRPGKVDPAKNIDKARKIQRLAEAQSNLTASPAEWVEWAQAQSPRLNVYTGFLLAVAGLPQATNKSGDAAAKGKAVERGISKQRVAIAFDGLKFTHARWLKNLAAPPKWLKADGIRVSVGSKSSSSLWNPALIATALLDKKIPIAKLNAVFNLTLKDWAADWKNASELEREND